MGRNGAGKSTLLRACAGLIEEIARGRVEAPLGCALLPQSPGDFLLRERVGDELPGEAGAEALARVGLEGLADRHPARALRRRAPAARAGDRHRGPGAAPASSASTSPPAAWTGPARRTWPPGSARSPMRAPPSSSPPTTSSSRRASPSASSCSATACVVADGGLREVLAGGWYFATEVARILPGPAPSCPLTAPRSCAAAARRQPGDLADRHLRDPRRRPRGRVRLVRALAAVGAPARARRRAGRARAPPAGSRFRRFRT